MTVYRVLRTFDPAYNDIPRPAACFEDETAYPWFRALLTAPGFQVQHPYGQCLVVLLASAWTFPGALEAGFLALAAGGRPVLYDWRFNYHLCERAARTLRKPTL